ncbi:hypothetical protein BZG14_10395 [Salinivibrio sp. IB282]|nr:hypothetical protein BZG14_10395 [Salinivibrio sp. IB282]
MVKQPVQALPQPSLRFFCTKVGTYTHFWQSHLVPLLFLEDFSSMPTRRLLVGFFMRGYGRDRVQKSVFIVIKITKLSPIDKIYRLF